MIFLHGARHRGNVRAACQPGQVSATMKSTAILFTAPGQVAVVEEDLRDPGEGEVTVRTIRSLVSTGTELICYRGERDEGTHWERYAAFPHRPGYCAVARVERLGPGVADLREGDRVCATIPHRQRANVTPAQLWAPVVPETVSDDEAAWVVLAVITQTGVRHAEHVMGDTAVVIGLGPLGQLVTGYLRALGLEQVLAVDPVPMRLEAALAHGATAGLCAGAAEAREFVLEHTQGRLADVVYDVTGHFAVLPSALQLARDFGKVVLLGDSPHPSRQRLTSDILARQVKLIGSRSSRLPPQYAHWTPQRQATLFLDYVQRGQMTVGDLITHRFDPREAPAAYRALAEKREETLGVVFDWGDV